MTALTVGIDIDDVLFPWYDLAHAASEKAGITNGVTPTQWAPYLEYGCTDREWFDVLDTALFEGMYLRAPLPGAIAAVRRIYEAGHQVHLVTARGALANGPSIKAATVEWINTFGVPYHGLHFTVDKTLVRVDVAIDDSPRNTDALEGAGVLTYLVDRPYNRDHDHPRRITHISEFATALELLTPAGKD